jgi:hypothetical protein
MTTDDARPNEEAEASPVVGAVPRTQEQLDSVINHQPPGWEYFLFAGALIMELDSLEARYEDYLMGYAPRLGVSIYEAQFMEFYQAQLNELMSIGQFIEQVFSDQVIDRALGPRGVSGDPAKILHLAKRCIGIYDELLRWTERLRGTSVPDKYRELVAILSKYSQQPIAEIRRFVLEYAAQVDRIPSVIASGNSLFIEVHVTFAIPPEISLELNNEWARLRRQARSSSSG